ncbi:MAG: Small GTP-binding domain protein [Promethearchaeota archaeon]|nr:MAG: Small GTP-binding domain protein [Candidatus Lokiarchaeota archaeon]
MGKTTLVYRYITKKFDLTLKRTMGVNLYVKFIDLDGIRTSLQIWDFGGEDTFRFLLPNYAFGSFGGIFMYDISKKESLHHITEWIPLFRSGLSDDKKDIPILLVGGKSDLKDERQCSPEESYGNLDLYNLFDGVECSSKSGENVDIVFEKMLRKIKEYTTT